MVNKIRTDCVVKLNPCNKDKLMSNTTEIEQNNPVSSPRIDLFPYESYESNAPTQKQQGYGQLNQVIKRYAISRSAFVRLRDTDDSFPSWFKRGKLCIYDLSKLDKYFSA